jgi:Xaa-Pro dipeptidase
MKQNVYQTRRGRVYDLMARENIALAMFEDTEGRRDANIRWLTGHPQDALLFLSVEKKAVLVPWDVNLAKIYADTDYLCAYTDFERLPVRACVKAADFLKIPPGSKIELPPVTPYPQFLKYIDALSGYDALCREEGLAAGLDQYRAIKDEAEITLYRRAAALTNEVIDALEEQLRAGRLAAELEAAAFIDAEARRRGCEGTGFETLAAGSGRSFAIHAFPAYTNETFGGKGLSILDFGLKFSGYTTDVTVTVAREPSRTQEKMITLVEKAAKLALSKAKSGAATRDIAAAVDDLFAKAGKAMPHALGHGIGLDAHESPALRNRGDNDWILQPGMVIALEPGLYHPLHGGCRLENDVLITEEGAETLTSARIIRL